MKIAIFSPYIPKHLGGGERHVLTSAWHLAKKHYVEVLVPTNSTDITAAKRHYEKFLNFSLEKVQFVPSPLADRTTSWWQNFKLSRQYDVFLYATDGSFFFSGAKRNILHVQIPFQNILSFTQRLKLNSWNIRNANSKFTQSVVQKAWQISLPYLHYPYVDSKNISLHFPLKKKKQILAVGRFFDPAHSDVHSKRQEILLEAFAQGYKKYKWDDVSFHLVGSIEPEEIHHQYVEKLRAQVKGLPVHFHHDISYTDLLKMYQDSLLFWHAAGFGIDEQKQPEKVEHFGMATLEAMAYGAIPIAVNAGGLKETVDHLQNGFLFTTIDELLERTNEVFSMKIDTLESFQKSAAEKAKYFSLEKFCETLDKMAGTV